ncbi:hypothetical protein TNCT_283101 [Trichonephila clavata]|uniref:Uncharacterized protein n=1 Tax=Trichonephila clavata TaxID=2740835 RepID=A0A8X6H614_TRICU|nr:hypothetical protein TNCT_283101 [Trichonephila clavata]
MRAVSVIPLRVIDASSFNKAEHEKCCSNILFKEDIAPNAKHRGCFTLAVLGIFRRWKGCKPSLRRIRHTVDADALITVPSARILVLGFRSTTLYRPSSKSVIRVSHIDSTNSFPSFRLKCFQSI